LSLEDLEPIHLAFDLSLAGGKQQSIFDGFPIAHAMRNEV